MWKALAVHLEWLVVRLLLVYFKQNATLLPRTHTMCGKEHSCWLINITSPPFFLPQSNIHFSSFYINFRYTMSAIMCGNADSMSDSENSENLEGVELEKAIWICSACPPVKTFDNVNGLRSHLKIHRGGKKLSICNKESCGELLYNGKNKDGSQHTHKKRYVKIDKVLKMISEHRIKEARVTDDD